MKYYKESDIRGARFNTISTPYSQGWNNGIDSILENATPIEIPKWIPIKSRPCTDEEFARNQEIFGDDISREEIAYFDCPMPDDGQEILVCNKFGSIWIDTNEIDPDYGFGLEENGDYDCVVAWMPLPEPYKEEES